MCLKTILRLSMYCCCRDIPADKSYYTDLTKHICNPSFHYRFNISINEHLLNDQSLPYRGSYCGCNISQNDHNKLFCPNCEALILPTLVVPIHTGVCPCLHKCAFMVSVFLNITSNRNKSCLNCYRDRI